MVASVTLGTPVPQISLPSDPWALDLNRHHWASSFSISCWCASVSAEKAECLHCGCIEDMDVNEAELESSNRLFCCPGHKISNNLLGSHAFPILSHPRASRPWTSENPKQMIWGFGRRHPDPHPELSRKPQGPWFIHLDSSGNPQLPQVTWLSQDPKGTPLLFSGGGTCLYEVTSPKWFLRLHSRHSFLTNAHGPPSWLLMWTTVQDGAPQSAASGPARDPRSHGNHSNGRDPSCVILASEICPSGRLAGCHQKPLNNKLTVGVLTQSRLHRAARANLSHCKMGPGGLQVNREVQVWPTACWVRAGLPLRAPLLRPPPHPDPAVLVPVGAHSCCRRG